MLLPVNEYYYWAKGQRPREYKKRGNGQSKRAHGHLLHQKKMREDMTM